jgi:hypothetical protein
LQQYIVANTAHKSATITASKIPVTHKESEIIKVMSESSTNPADRNDQNQMVALIPIEQREVDFYGDNLTASLVDTSEGQQVYVPLRPICDYLGLNWSGQLQRLRRDDIFNEAQGVCMIHTPGGGRQEMVCLPLDLLPGWLFGVDAARVKPELRDKIKRYQRYCFRILSQAFQAEALNLTGTIETTTATTPASAVNVPMSLAQIRDLGRAMTQFAEQQMLFEQEQAVIKEQQLVLEQRQQAFEQALASNEQVADAAGQLAASAHERLNQAANVVRQIRNQLNVLDARTSPQGNINDEQASQIALTVKALATHLKQLNPQGPNQYQAVYTELYRRFGVSSYKQVRRNQFEDVLSFLEEWRSTGNVSSNQ